METYTADHRFAQKVKDAIEALKSRNYDLAQECIKSAMVENIDSPEIQNLLGALAELKGDLGLARKHYRAAYALDQTFKAASINLDRLSSFSYKVVDEPDYGDQPEKTDNHI